MHGCPTCISDDNASAIEVGVWEDEIVGKGAVYEASVCALPCIHCPVASKVYEGAICRRHTSLPHASPRMFYPSLPLLDMGDKLHIQSLNMRRLLPVTLASLK